MFKLIMKDILLQKKILAFSAVYFLFLIFAFQSASGEAVLPMGVSAITYIMIQNACAYDDKYKADVMLCSLPVRRSSIVMARYIAAFVFVLLGIVEYGLLAAVAATGILPVRIDPLSVSGLIGTLLAVSVLFGIYLPVFYKFGYIKAKIFNLVIFFTVFFGSSTVVYFMKYKMESPVISSMQNAALKDWQIAVITVLIMIAMLAASCLLSIRLYRRREF